TDRLVGKGVRQPDTDVGAAGRGARGQTHRLVLPRADLDVAGGRASPRGRPRVVGGASAHREDVHTGGLVVHSRQDDMVDLTIGVDRDRTGVHADRTDLAGFFPVLGVGVGQVERRVAGRALGPVGDL